MSEGELKTAKGSLLPASAFGIILIGASGTGKSSSASELQKQKIVHVQPTVATRRLRPVEQESPPCDHTFASNEQFDEWEEAGRFIDTKTIYGSRYGVPWLEKPPEDHVPLLVLKPDFVEPVVAEYPYMQTYQLEASADTVLKRMRARGQAETDIAERMRKHGSETLIGRKLADCIFNNEGSLEHTVERMAEQICADLALHLIDSPVG